MKYTVVVKDIISSNGDFVRQRFNNVSKKIIKFLLKYHFSFMVGIAENVVNREEAKNYIEIYKKSTSFVSDDDEFERNYWLNILLLDKLKKYSKRK